MTGPGRRLLVQGRHLQPHLDEADGWLWHQPWCTVPIRMSVNGFDVYTAD